MWREMEEKSEQTTDVVEQPAKKSRFSFRDLLKGDTTKERLENWSFIIFVLSAILVIFGIGLGSFVYGTIYVATFGSFLFMIGIIIFIISQFFEEVK